MKKLTLANSDRYVIIDDEDYERASKYNLRIKDLSKKKPYVMAGWHERLHNILMKPPPGYEVDHINGDTLDCRRSNMRLCTREQNLWNQENKESGITKIHDNKWRARVGYRYKVIHVGYFKTREEAVEALQAKKRELYGEFF